MRQLSSLHWWQELNRSLMSGLQPGRTVLQALALRQLAEGHVIREVAADLGLTPPTVWLTDQRYQQGNRAAWNGLVRAGPPGGRSVVGSPTVAARRCFGVQ